jgi:hypothetical protein
MAPHLRLFTAAEAGPAAPPAPSVRISLRDMLPLIALAQRHNYLWLQDFLDDEVCVTEDLYDILRAFRAYRPSA